MLHILSRTSHAICACVLALLAAMPAQADAPPESGNSIQAVWKAHNVLFEFRAGSKLYSCIVLEEKIGMILRTLGARDGLTLRGHTCDASRGRARFEVMMESPVVATEENIRALTAYTAEEELAARVRGVRLPAAHEIPRFLAAWKPVSFRQSARMNLDNGDCALLLQVRRQILPLMSVRVTKDIGIVDCSEELLGMAGPRLTAVALVPE